eukprot:EG_transcript_13949
MEVCLVGLLGSGLPVSRWVHAVEERLTCPSDSFETRDGTLMVVFATVALCVREAAWGCLLAPRHSAASVALSGLTLALCAAGLWHMAATRAVDVARYLLCFTACGSTVGLLWLLPGTSLTALNWALLMPHLLVTTGGNVKISSGVLVLLIAVSIALCVSRSGTPRPSPPPFPAAAFDCFNLVAPSLVSFGLTCFLLHRTRSRRKALDETLAKAVMAERIVAFHGAHAAGPARAAMVRSLMEQVLAHLRPHHRYEPPAAPLDGPPAAAADGGGDRPEGEGEEEEAEESDDSEAGGKLEQGSSLFLPRPLRQRRFL